MPHRRALQVTTPSHGIALGIYALTAALGVFHLTDIAAAKALTDRIGVGAANLWAVGMMAGGGTAFTAAVTARPHNIVRDLAAEAIGCAAMGLAFGLYLWSLFSGYSGFTSSMTTKSLSAAVIVGCIIRIVQIIRERNRVQAALSQPVPANPPPLADPTN